MKKFDYQVCTAQYGRVTFVNQAWIGKVPIREGNTDKAIASCPFIHEYLLGAGSEGWELVTSDSQRTGQSTNTTADTTQTLFLKREK
jgi:hypothetical protein